MKREIKSATGKDIRAPEAPRAEIKAFGEAAENMIQQMGKIFRNQALEYLNKTTLKKFEDAQVGNFAAVYLAQANRINKKLLKRFDQKRMKAMSERYTSRVDRRNKKELYSRLEESVGISRQELEATEGLTSQINAYKLETLQWTKKLRDETLQQWTSATLRSMAEGQDLTQILSQFDGMVEKRKGHAKMVARTQIGTFNSLTTKARAQNLGITLAVWDTAGDERVRPCHQIRNGKEFDLSVGLYSSCDGKTLLPAVDYNCRCGYILKIPKMEG